MTAVRANDAPRTTPYAERAEVRVGLVGKGIGLSRTPAMHIAEGKAQGVALRYELIDPDEMTGPEPSIEDLLAKVEAEGYAGVNVTFPYKKAVMAHLDSLSEAAERVGAVNTVVFADGKRHGHNTDYWGFLESLKRSLPNAKKDRVLLLGAGGAGGAVAHALVAHGVGTVLVHDTNAAAATALAAAIGGAAVSDIAEAARSADGIVNATPMGMDKLPGMAIDPALIEPRHWVADIVYFPMETELLRVARARGCKTLDGGGMAVFQAVRAFTLFTGLTPDPARMRATFEAFADPEIKPQD